MEKDPWGILFKLVRPLPILGINKPGRLLNIVQGLFPRHQKRVSVNWSQYTGREAEPILIGVDKLKMAAQSLKRNILPGTDGTPNEAIMHLVCIQQNALTKV